MSSRKLSSSREVQPSSRHGERTPLRSLDNEILHFSTPSSELKTGWKFSSEAARTAMGSFSPEFHLNSPAFTKTTQSSPHVECGPEDVTFKSFMCAGGEVEIPESSVCHQASIILPTLADTCCSETNDTIPCPSVMEQSYCDHAEHPYCNPNMDKTRSVLVGSPSLGDTPTRVSFDDTSDRLPNTGSEDPHVTLKSFNCHGGEVEVSDATKLQDKTIPLPPELGSLEDHSTTIANLSICTHLCQEEHADHPYCIKEDCSLTETTGASEQPGSKELPSKMFTCGEDEILFSEDEKNILHLPAVSSKESSNDDMDSSVLASEHDLQSDYLPCCAPKDSSSQHEQIFSNLEILRSSGAFGDDHLDGTLPNVQGDPDEAGKAADDSSSLPEQNPIEKEGVDDDGDSSVCNESMNKWTPGALLREVMDCEVTDVTVTHPSALPGPTESSVDHSAAQHVNASHSSSESSDVKDSAISSSSANTPFLCNSTEKPLKNTPAVLKVLSECHSLASALKLGILSPIVKRASLSLLKASEQITKDKHLADNSVFEVDKSLVAPSGLCAEYLESPMPRPLFNSTVLFHKFSPPSTTVQEGDSGKDSCAEPQPEVKQPSEEIPLIPEGQLQQQLLQMAQFLILACEKMGPTAASTSAPSLLRTTPAESLSVCVGTSPVKLVDCSLNTSGLFERKREFSVTDSCTLTEPLLWNLPPGSLESLPRQELEQRLRSSTIMVEALVQQLAAARAHGGVCTGTAPSDLREKLVQTDHTELNQTTMYRDLYLEALSRIEKLELDGESLQTLLSSLGDVRTTMADLAGETDAALSSMKKMTVNVRADHQSLLSHYGQMKALLLKSKESQMRTMEKVKEVISQRNDMRTQMEEAFTAKEAAFSAMEQLRIHCSAEISALEESVGSQQQLMAALNQTYPEQVALNKTCSETLKSTNELLSQTRDEHSSLMSELWRVQKLLQRTIPMLLRLKETTADALKERDELVSARDEANMEKEQMEEELKETCVNLQDAKQQIGDLNLQITILTSEMGVLRQKLTEEEEEKAQLDRKVTELSATISSTLASYTFLEQALAAETDKLQLSWKEIQQANERANQLEASLGDSEQRVCELSQTLAHREEQLSQLQSLSQSQGLQIQQLQDTCAQLCNVKEINEFLEMENVLLREQVAESESLLRANTQSLWERNIQCEDLRGEVGKLQVENQQLRDQIMVSKSAADSIRQEFEEKMAQAVTEITLLHHTLRGVTNELHAALSNQNREPQNVEPGPPSSSFVGSIMGALTAEQQIDTRTEQPAGSESSDKPDSNGEAFFSETSAFTRVGTRKQSTKAEEEEEQSSVADLLSGLGCTVAELAAALKSVLQQKDALLEELQRRICSLQVEQQTTANKHEAEVLELTLQLGRLNNLVEKGNQALQQKAQDEKTLNKLVADVQEAQEILSKHKNDNNELRRDVTELRRSLQESRVESQFLREELKKAGGQSSYPAHYMEEKIQLLKEVERLKVRLQEADQARGKLLERAKRHQIIHQTNQQKSENELQILNSMINKVRETLLSLPDVVQKCDQLRQLAEYIG
ncbi:Sperm-associated antigen 5 [Oryzias melastigma]|uniref:Sperm-associated antigen 5 n=1 Tax=Oryzias melastigma TaxID=30732 RepID=A0A834CMZ3_ORYME|nr:Sperm-associated antigen 5 [Oryzias melastigma]